MGSGWEQQGKVIHHPQILMHLGQGRQGPWLARLHMSPFQRGKTRVGRGQPIPTLDSEGL